MITREDLKSIQFTPIEESLKLVDISDDVYFSSQYKNYVSNSRLKNINPLEGGSPELYFKGSPKLFTDSLVFGTAVHELVLQPNNFMLNSDIVLPPGKPGLIAELAHTSNGILPHDNTLLDYCKLVDYWNGSPSISTLDKLKTIIKDFIKDRTEFEKTYYADKKDLPKPIYLTSNNLTRIKGCLDSINSNNAIQQLLHPIDLMGDPLISENERTILLDVEARMPGCKPVILHLKSKLDNYSIDTINSSIVVNDVKTTSSMEYFIGAIRKYHYYREMGMYSWLLAKCAKQFFKIDKPNISSHFLVVETKPSYASKVVECNSSMLLAGMKEFIYLLRLVAYHSMHDYADYV